MTDNKTTAECIDNCRISIISCALVDKLLDQNHTFSLRLLRHVSENIGKQQDKTFETLTQSVDTRLTHFLWQLSEKQMGEAESASSTIELPYSRRIVAELLCTTPESVSRAIRKMEDTGVAHFEKRSVFIPAINRIQPDSRWASNSIH